MDKKKKRGNNYTAAEKQFLLELIRKYQNVIENKDIHADMNLKKREAWDSVCQQYNAVAVSGIRTWQQLRHFYENIKQRSKKTMTDINWFQFYEKSKNNKKMGILDKKKKNCTEGGAYKNSLAEQDTQILSTPEVQSLINSYDDPTLDIGEVNKKNEANIKQKYFKVKLRNAELEQKYLINKNRMEMNKYKIEMEILKLRLNKLKSQRN